MAPGTERRVLTSDLHLAPLRVLASSRETNGLPYPIERAITPNRQWQVFPWHEAVHRGLRIGSLGSPPTDTSDGAFFCPRTPFPRLGH